MTTEVEYQKNKYRSSFTATILFSGVQLYQILVRVIKSKFVALFIGPAGMGIASLLRSTTDLLSACTNLGLKTSGVKAVAAANSEQDRDSIIKIVTVLRRLILCTGLLGLIICAALAPLWSNLSFKSSDYIISFVFVSFVILFDQLNNGELVVLQGMQQKKTLAKANMVGQTVGLLLTIPLYYFWGIKAIVWVLVLSSLFTFVITRFYSSTLQIGKIKISWKDTFSIGGGMIKLGFFLSLQFLLQQAIMFLIRNYVSRTGGLEEVGLYSAGTNIVTTYLGLVFAAIATDYFPRLSATKTNDELKDAVHTQAEISILLFAPLLVAFIVFAKPIIILLYSSKFLPIENMMYWAVGATLVQAMGWAVSYTLLAKARPSTFFVNELVASLYSVPLRIYGYSVYGLTGFGIATFVGYALYLLQVLYVSNNLFGFSYRKNIWPLFLGLNCPIIISVVLKIFLSEIYGYVWGFIILVITSYYVLNNLNKKMDLFAAFRSRLKR